MKAEDLVYDVLTLLGKVNDDGLPMEEFILRKLTNYRSLIIRQNFSRDGLVEDVMFLNYPKISVEKINSADDPSITVSSITVGKAEFPETLILKNGIGLNVTGSSRQLGLTNIDFSTMMLKAKFNDIPHPDIVYFDIIGNHIYTWPYIIELSAKGIPMNPMDIQVNESGALRTRLLTDFYPISESVAQEAIIRFLTVDWKLSKEEISDLINDSQDQLKVMNSGYAH